MGSETVYTIGIFGSFQIGKSTLLNAMTGRHLAQVGGVGLSTTAKNTVYGRTLCDCPILRRYNLLDCPGINANEADSALAEQAIKKSDAAIVVLPNRGVKEHELRLIGRIDDTGMPYHVVMNCLPALSPVAWNPASDYNAEMCEQIEAAILDNGFLPVAYADGSRILAVNAAWHCFLNGLMEDGEGERLVADRCRAYPSQSKIADENCGVSSLVEFLLDDFWPARLRALARVGELCRRLRADSASAVTAMLGKQVFSLRMTAGKTARALRTDRSDTHAEFISEIEKILNRH